MATSRKLLLSAVAASSSASRSRPKRRHAHRRVFAAPRDGGQRLGIVGQPVERRLADAFALGGLGDEHLLFQRSRGRQDAKGIERGEARGLVGLEGAQRDVQQHAGGLIAHGLVCVGTQNLRQRPNRAELAHRRLAHARIVVGACHFGQHVLLIFRKLVNTSESDLGVGVLPLWLRFESVENAHGSGGRDWLQSPLKGVETG